jgi:F420-non-reducing hydrogenase large subunit
MGRRYTIDPITRLEGHGKIEIFTDDDGNVINAYFQVPQLRGFEKFCQGRPVEEVPRIVPRICGVCPEAHHLCSAKAVDAVYNVDPPPAAKKLRELMYMAHYVHSHIAHFYALAAADFVVGPQAPVAERNILGVVAKVGLEVGGQVIKQRSNAQKVQEIIGGKATHPVCALPGGMSKHLVEEERESIERMGVEAEDFAMFGLDLFNDVVLKNQEYLELIKSDMYSLNIHNMGLVDENNAVNFYHGKVRVVDTNGKELCKYSPSEYLNFVSEHVEPFSYLKYPFLKKIGWKGFVEGQDGPLYWATPLSRLNAADAMATPRAQEAYKIFYKALGGKPVKATLATHWARLIEILYATERWLQLVRDPEITSRDIRADLTGKVPHEGVGILEAPRGTLTHHYITDENGMVQKVNLIVGTTNNNGPISLSIKKAAQGLIKKGVKVQEGILNMVEMAFRAYDPCLSCATHSVPGRIPLLINIRDKEGNILETIKS